MIGSVSIRFELTTSGASVSFGLPRVQEMSRLSTIMDEKNPSMLAIAQHPGLILKDELAELGISMAALARAIDVPPGRISAIVAGKHAISGDTALRLGHWFGTSPQFWLNLQAHYDLALAAQAVGHEIERLPMRPGLAA